MSEDKRPSKAWAWVFLILGVAPFLAAAGSGGTESAGGLALLFLGLAWYQFHRIRKWDRTHLPWHKTQP